MKAVVRQTEQGDEREMSAKDLPEFAQLKEEVTAILDRCSWKESFGQQTFEFFLAGIAFVIGLLLLCSSSWAGFILGFLLYGGSQTVLSTRAGHLSAHGGLCRSAAGNRCFAWFFTEIIGSFSVRIGREVHLVEHHPHTNIVGRGDSSTWRVPFLPRSLYFFVAPLLMPMFGPVVSVGMLWGRWMSLVSYCASASFGLAASAWPLVAIGGFSPCSAVGILFAARSPLQVPLLHFNVFQHIGLPMFDPVARPPRLLQMSSGVLNLQGHPFLLAFFGHSLIDCHVEHHLFPRLSDDLLKKIQPVVRRFLLQHGLPYNDKPYTERLTHFFKNYKTLLVNAPPLYRFVGLQ